MKILYLYSDYKWTGPSQPIVELCNFMSEKAEVFLLMSTPKHPESRFVSHVRTDRVHLIQGLQKRGGIGSLMKNRRLIMQSIRQVKPDVIHFFRERDMITLPGNSKNFIKVFSSLKGSYPGRLKKILWKTANVITVFQKKLHDDLLQELDKVFYIKPWLDLQQIPVHHQNIRPAFGLREEDFVVGLVMRVQPYRRFDLVIETAKLIKESKKRIKFLLFGKGPYLKKLVLEPMERYGLADVIIPGGYRKHDYWDALHSFDIMFYTVAGSDGTARALRQCQAMGRPVICLHDDFMREIVQDGVNGFVVHNDPKEIMEKIDALYSDRALFTDFSKRSESQGKTYDLSKIGQEIYALYEDQLKIKTENFLQHVSISEMDNHE